MAIDKIQSESINLADTFAFTGTVTGAGGDNKPAFQVRESSGISCADNTHTKMTFSTEDFDSDNKFDLSNNRFTPTVVGKYFIYGKIYEPFNSPDIDNVSVSIYKNGSNVSGGGASWVHRNVQTGLTSVTVDLDADDYVEMYARQTAGNTQSLVPVLFGGYKLIT